MQYPKHLSLIIIYGAAGAGKTTSTDMLHDELSHTAHIGLDHIKRFISEFRTVPAHNDVSKKVINAMVAEYLKNNISVIVEHGMDRGEIETLAHIAAQNQAKIFIYRLNAARTIRDGRVTQRSTELGKPQISKEELDQHEQRHESNDYPNTKMFDSGTMSTREIADAILINLT